MANYGLTFTVDSPYLLEEGVNVRDFPILVKIPIANTTNLYGTGETGDTIYFESEGEVLKHELVEITATYCTAWIKMDLETSSKKVVTLHYGALVDNNYEDKRGVWVNGISIYHFKTDGTDTMGINNLTPTANIVFGGIGEYDNGVYIPNGHGLSGTEQSITGTFTAILLKASIRLNSSGYNYILASSGNGNATMVSYYNYKPGQIYCHTTTNGFFSPYILPITTLNIGFTKAGTIASPIWYINNSIYASEQTGTPAVTPTYGCIGRLAAGTCSAFPMSMAEVFYFTDVKSPYWVLALYRMYNNPDAYIEYGNEVDLDALTDIEEIPVDCVANINKQLGIYDIDFRNIMYEVGDFNATWRLPGTEGITIWGIYQPRPVGDYFFPDMDNVGINDSLFFTVTDYLVDIHDKIDIEGVRFDLQAIQVHQIADQKIYKMCVLKRQPEYYATCKGSVS